MQDPVIEARDLTKHYGETVGLDGLELQVAPGEVFGFLGPNGAGKTTTIRLLLDLIRPTRGNARVLGHPACESRVRCRIGYLPGELTLDGRMSGHQTLALLGALSGQRPPATRRRAELCERLGLAESDLVRRVRDYSRGMKQKIGLISAFQHDPDLLVLDEPTTGLDPLVRETVFQLLTEAGAAGKTVFHSSHVLSEIDRTCHRVGIVRKGRLLSVMRIDDVREAAVRRMVVRFETRPPIGELELPGVACVSHDETRVVLEVSGELDPLIRVLARHNVRQLVFPEPSLEQAFARFYEDDA